MVRNNDEMIQKLKELENKVLGCWCKPWFCHGDILIKLYNEFYNPKTSKTSHKEKDNSKRALDDADKDDAESEATCAKKMKKD